MLRTSLLVVASMAMMLSPCSEAFQTASSISQRNAISRGMISRKPMIFRTSMALDPAKIAPWIELGEAAVKAEGASQTKQKAKKALSKALNKASKALAVALECSTGMPLTSSDAKDPYQIAGLTGFSQLLRTALACGIWVKKEKGGADMDLLEAMCNEQKTAKGNFPGPVCVVRDGVSSIQEAAEACAAGCSAVSLSLPPLSPTTVQELVWAAHGMGMEAVVTVSTDLIEMATDTGADIVCIDDNGNTEEVIEASKKIPKGVVPLVKIPSQPFEEDKILRARDLKDAGILAVLFSGVCTGEQEDLDAAPFTIAEATSKRSNTVNLNFTGANRKDPAGARKLMGEMPDMGVPSAAATPPPRAVKKTSGTPVGGDMFGLDEVVVNDLAWYGLQFL